MFSRFYINVAELMEQQEKNFIINYDEILPIITITTGR